MNKAVEDVFSPVDPPSLRGQLRVSKILEAATELFLREGYDATPVDSIVERSGGSKATLYSYFPTKADLFRAVVDRVASRSTAAAPSLEGGAVEDELRDFSIRRLALVFSEEHQALLRLVISERDRFPDLAKTYYHRSTRPAYDSIAVLLTALHERGRLSIDDVPEAVEFYVAMLFFPWYTRHLLFKAALPTADDIAANVDRVMERFFRIYSPR